MIAQNKNKATDTYNKSFGFKMKFVLENMNFFPSPNNE